MRVLVVWEPILITDWGAPSSSTLARVYDSRARQFWDPKHLISGALRRAAEGMSSMPQPNSGRRFYWDEALVFAPHAKWTSQPLFWQGPVYQVVDGLATALRSLTQKSENGNLKNLSERAQVQSQGLQLETESLALVSELAPSVGGGKRFSASALFGEDIPVRFH
ncbi:MAG TPA: hypothetical protein VEJ45_12515 [Candidatus Acidoferrales bacterium]|nr:hypothetical protein [Candidatus Acidoferrales bacterium]